MKIKRKQKREQKRKQSKTKKRKQTKNENKRQKTKKKTSAQNKHLCSLFACVIIITSYNFILFCWKEVFIIYLETPVSFTQNCPPWQMSGGHAGHFTASLALSLLDQKVFPGPVSQASFSATPGRRNSFPLYAS